LPQDFLTNKELLLSSKKLGVFKHLKTQKIFKENKDAFLI